MARTEVRGGQITDASVSLTVDVTGTLPVANGGTGAATQSLNNVLLGNGTGAFQNIAPSTSGNVLTSNGTTWSSTAPAAGSGTSSSRSITQAAHGLAVGNAVYLNGTTYTKAIATSSAAAEAVGVVSVVTDANTFTLVTHGHLTGLTGLTAGSTYFVSETTAGALSTTEPAAPNVSKPVMLADSTTSGYVLNMRGTIGSASGTSVEPRMTRLTLASDITNATVTPASLTGMSFTFEANATYVIDMYMIATSAAITTGYGFAIDTSVAVTNIALTFGHQLANTGTLTGGSSISDNTITGVSSGVPTAATVVPIIGGGLLRAGATGGTAQFMFAAEVAASATCKAGSVIRVMKV